MGGQQYPPKAIRRSEATVAERAALTFLQQAGSAIWRRFMIIAFEDIGVASPEIVAMAVAASTDANSRKNVGGDQRVAIELARILSNAPKSRSAEHLITTVIGLGQFQSIRNVNARNRGQNNGDWHFISRVGMGATPVIPEGTHRKSGKTQLTDNVGAPDTIRTCDLCLRRANVMKTAAERPGLTRSQHEFSISGLG